ATLIMAVFGSHALFPAVVIFMLPVAGAWYLRKRTEGRAKMNKNITDLGSITVAGNTIHFTGELSVGKDSRKNNGEEKGIQCPHCAAEFEEMPKRKRRCPHCKDWIWPMRPPGMLHKRLTTVEQASIWKLETARLEGMFAYALELARQEKPFQQALFDAHREKLLEYREDGIIWVKVNNSSDSCPACKKIPSGKRRIKDELADQRLPCMSCSSPLHGKKNVVGWCLCDYVIII
ncbi:hypothetical protein JYT78_01825, partial [bacterium AH-315-I20]|nr:hypothetical protein [bacterium AH-315-I20]